MKFIQNINMSRNIFLVASLMLFMAVGLNAQNERYFDERYISGMSFLNPVLVNPGATGHDNDHSIFLTYKNNWSTFERSPKSFIASYDGPVADRLGFGAMVLTDANGDLKTTKFQGSVSYTIDTPTNKIGFGISAEYIQHGLSSDVFSDPLFQPNDILVNNRIAGTNFFDVSFGVFGVYNGKITYGLALPSLVSSRISNTDNEGTREIGYLFNVGYRIDDLDSDLVLEPSVFVKKLMNVPFHADVNVLARFLGDRFRGGVTYTVGADEKLGFLMGVNVNSMQFNYAYSASRSDFQTYNNGAHEISIRFNLASSQYNAAETGDN